MNCKTIERTFSIELGKEGSFWHIAIDRARYCTVQTDDAPVVTTPSEDKQ